MHFAISPNTRLHTPNICRSLDIRQHSISIIVTASTGCPGHEDASTASATFGLSRPYSHVVSRLIHHDLLDSSIPETQCNAKEVQLPKPSVALANDKRRRSSNYNLSFGARIPEVVLHFHTVCTVQDRRCSLSKKYLFRMFQDVISPLGMSSEEWTALFRLPNLFPIRQC